MNKIIFTTRQSCLISKSNHQPLYTCLICQDIPVRPRKCNKCECVFCQICTIKWKQNSNLCPSRCSSKWVLSLVEIPSNYFKCPYNQKCNDIIDTQFQEHLLKCQSTPQHIKTVQRHKQHYLCINQHKLKFNSDRFAGQYLTKCFQCQESKYCRNQCIKCNHSYCGKCRIPPLTKKYCPGKCHQYINKNPHPGFSCQKCGLQPQVLGIRCYDDMSCNFGLCQWCYQQLPQYQQGQNEQLNHENQGRTSWLLRNNLMQKNLILNPEIKQ